MSTGRHRAQDDSELPTFTGDVPEDVALAGKLVRRRFYTIFAQGYSGFCSATLLVSVWSSILVGVAQLISPDALHEHPVALVIGLSVAGVACGVPSLVRPVPGWIRFVVGAAPAGGLLIAASFAGTSYHTDFGYTPLALGLAAPVAGVTYILVGGLKFWNHYKRRLAALDSTKATERTTDQVS